ncbi:transcriptional regulator, partial [Saccharopolyspora terrae]
RVDHPQVGELVLNRERLGVEGSPGQALVIFHPDPGTDSAEKLALLAAASVTGRSGQDASERAC